MTESTLPPRLRVSNDPAIRNVIVALASDSIEPSRAAQALARLEASEAFAPGAPRAPQGTRWRPMAKAVVTSVVALCALTTAMIMRSAPEVPSPVVVVPPPPIAPAPFAPSTPAGEPEAQSEAVRVEDLPPAAASAAPHHPKQATSAAPGSTFREELALVQSARTSLKDGDTDTCLRALDRYDRLYHGVFLDEVVMIRIEALIARGEGERARTIARDFLTKHPDSPYESRIRSLLSKGP